MRLKILVAALMMSELVVGCAPQTRFEWGDYENGLYRYYKNAEAAEVYKGSLEKALAKGEASQRVAPGLNAELGYLALEDGDTQSAIAQFEKEMAAFPESRIFLTGVIARIKTMAASGPSSAATAVAEGAGS